MSERQRPDDLEPGDGSDQDELRPGAVPAWEPAPPPTFPHPPWTVGLVLVIAVVMLILGIFGHPLWLLLGSPFILTLGVWAWVQVIVWRRRRAGLDRFGDPIEDVDAERGPDDGAPPAGH